MEHHFNVIPPRKFPGGDFFARAAVYSSVSHSRSLGRYNDLVWRECFTTECSCTALKGLTLRLTLRILGSELIAIASFLLLAIALASCESPNDNGDQIPDDLEPSPPVGKVSKQIDRPGDALRIGFDIAL